MSRRNRAIRAGRAVLILTTAAMLSAACGGSTSPPAQELAANGVAELSAPEAFAKAKTAFTDAPTVHISGTGNVDGEQMDLDFWFKGAEGGKGQGTVDGQQVEMIRLGQDFYFKAEEAFWADVTDDPEAAREMASKYLKTSANDPDLRLMAVFTDISAFSTRFLTPDGSFTMGERRTIRGIEAVGLTETGPRGETIYVAVEGPAYPLQLSTNKPDDTQTLDFVEYGAPVEVTEPPADQVLDMADVLNS
jgi:hypothetical protein